MRYDLIIVGGGLVGAGLAASLADTNKKIALIDAKLPSNQDPRLFALNHSSCTFLENLNLWQALKPHAAEIRQVHVSKKGSFGAVRLSNQDAGLASLGHVIPAYQIESALNANLLSLANVTIYRPALVTALAHHQVTVKVAAEEIMLEAPLIIGADGVDSSVRKLSGMTASVVDYQQTAIVTRTTLQRPHQHVAYERFNDHGAIAMLPLVGNECATIWTVSNEKAETLIGLSDAEFLQQLQTEFGYRLGKLVAIKARHQFPLRMVRAEENSRDGILLVGNAAHALHPIAAAGFNLALYEVAVLREALLQDAVPDLMTVCEKIKTQIATSVAVSHHLGELFHHSSPLMKRFLPIGMSAMDKVPLLRRTFIEKMLGRRGKMPQLLMDAGEE